MRVLILAITSISALLHRIHLYGGASGLQIVTRRSDEGPALTTCDVESAPSFRLHGSWSHRGRDTAAPSRVTRVCAPTRASGCSCGRAPLREARADSAGRRTSVATTTEERRPHVVARSSRPRNEARVCGAAHGGRRTQPPATNVRLFPQSRRSSSALLSAGGGAPRRP